MNVVTFGPTVLVTRLAANAALVFRWILYPVPLATSVQVSRTAVRPKRSGRTADAYGTEIGPTMLEVLVTSRVEYLGTPT